MKNIKDASGTNQLKFLKVTEFIIQRVPVVNKEKVLVVFHFQLCYSFQWFDIQNYRLISDYGAGKPAHALIWLESLFNCV